MAAKETIGKAPCGTCGEEIPVKQSAARGLSLCCPWCDIRKYTQAGTQAHRLELAKVVKEAEPQPQPQPQPQPAPVKKASGLFTPS